MDTTGFPPRLDAQPTSPRPSCAGCRQRLGLDPADPAAEVIHDHIPQSAPARKVRNVLSILDQIDREQSNRRFTT